MTIFSIYSDIGFFLAQSQDEDYGETKNIVKWVGDKSLEIE